MLETRHENTFVSIEFETRSPTVALCVRCRFDRGRGRYRRERHLNA